jgi:hypothetical protein
MANVDYSLVVVDLKERRRVLDGLITGIESLMGADPEEPVEIPFKFKKFDAVAALAFSRNPPPKGKYKAKAKKTALAKPARSSVAGAGSVPPPEDDGIEGNISTTQAILRALNEMPRTPTELKERVGSLRPGTTASIIDSTVHYLKAKNYLRKSSDDGRFYVVDQRMQNGSGAVHA